VKADESHAEPAMAPPAKNDKKDEKKAEPAKK
jgi:hypothetical protein